MGTEVHGYMFMMRKMDIYRQLDTPTSWTFLFPTTNTTSPLSSFHLFPCIRISSPFQWPLTPWLIGLW